MKLIVDTIADFISSLTISGTVLSGTFDGTETVFLFSNSYHLRENRSFFVSATEYTATQVNAELNQVTVLGDFTGLIGQTFIIPNPFYFHGTPIATNNQINFLDDLEKVPMIYLYEWIREKEFPETSNLESEANVTLYFLDNANFEDWTTDNFYTKRIYGLRKLFSFFKEELRKYSKFYTTETDFFIENMTKFGTFQKMKGAVSKVFDDPLTGVQVSFKLRIRKCCN